MSTVDRNAIIIRELTSSDLGWFAEAQDSGRVASKQRAINFNAAIIAAVLPARLRAKSDNIACTLRACRGNSGGGKTSIESR